MFINEIKKHTMLGFASAFTITVNKLPTGPRIKAAFLKNVIFILSTFEIEFLDWLFAVYYSIRSADSSTCNKLCEFSFRTLGFFFSWVQLFLRGFFSIINLRILILLLFFRWAVVLQGKKFYTVLFISTLLSKGLNSQDYFRRL